MDILEKRHPQFLDHLGHLHAFTPEHSEMTNLTEFQDFLDVTFVKKDDYAGLMYPDGLQQHRLYSTLGSHGNVCFRHFYEIALSKAAFFITSYSHNIPRIEIQSKVVWKCMLMYPSQTLHIPVTVEQPESET